MISDDSELAKTFNSYCEKLVIKLGIKEYENFDTNLDSRSLDNVDVGINKYKKKTIQVSKLLMKKYHLNQDISESDIQKNSNLNSKKAKTFGNLQKYAKSLQIFVMQCLEIFGILNY